MLVVLFLNMLERIFMVFDLWCWVIWCGVLGLCWLRLCWSLLWISSAIGVLVVLFLNMLERIFMVFDLWCCDGRGCCISVSRCSWCGWDGRFW